MFFFNNLKRSQLRPTKNGGDLIHKNLGLVS